MGCALLQQCWGRLPHGGWELILLGLLCVIFVTLIYHHPLPIKDGATYSYWFSSASSPWAESITYKPISLRAADVWVASLICGLVIDTLLVVNNYRDREQDALSGKRTLIVRFGEPSAVTCIWIR